MCVIAKCVVHVTRIVVGGFAFVFVTQALDTGNEYALKVSCGYVNATSTVIKVFGDKWKEMIVQFNICLCLTLKLE